MGVTAKQVTLLFDFTAYHRELDAIFVEPINQRRASEGRGWSKDATTEIKYDKVIAVESTGKYYFV